MIQFHLRWEERNARIRAEEEEAKMKAREKALAIERKREAQAAREEQRAKGRRTPPSQMMNERRGDDEIRRTLPIENTFELVPLGTGGIDPMKISAAFSSSNYCVK